MPAFRGTRFAFRFMDDDETNIQQFLFGVTLGTEMLKSGVPSRRRVAQPEGLDDGIAQMALIVDVIQGEFPGRCGKMVTVERHGFFQQAAQALVGFFFLRLFGLVGFQFDPGAFRHGLQGFLEIPTFLLHYEPEDIAALVTLAETAPGLPVWRNDEGGGFLVVEGAQAGIILSGAAQFHGFPDQVYDIDAGFDIINLGHLV